MTVSRLLVIGLDGLEPSLVKRWTRSGDLPNLASLRQSARWGPLLSTIPFATFPAWTTFMTGVNPGEHGVFDFARFAPGTRDVEFVGAAVRRRPIFPRLASDAGLRVACLGFPGTYPPEPLNGVMISGFDSPVAVGIDDSFVRPKSLKGELERRFGRYVFADFAETRSWLPGWHRRAAKKLMAGLERRSDMACWLAEEKEWDLFMVHFGESDTAAHHFWAFHDPLSPRRPATVEPELERVLVDVYRSLDAAVGRLLATTGPETTVLIASDHGFGGASDKVLHLNRWLASRGYLSWSPGRRRADKLRGLGVRTALNVLPGRVQERLWRSAPHLAGRVEGGRRLSGIDFSSTAAFSEELAYHPSIRLNVAGRWPGASLDRSDAAMVASDIAAELGSLRDPWSGAPVVERVWRREELYSGPAVEEAPDLLLELALDGGYSYNVLPSPGHGPTWRKLARSEMLGAKGAGMNGTHRRDGYWLLRGPGIAPRRARAAMEDLAPSALSALGLRPTAWMEGRSHVASTGREPVAQAVAGPGQPAAPYTRKQQRIIEDRLRRLGYL